MSVVEQVENYFNHVYTLIISEYLYEIIYPKTQICRNLLGLLLYPSVLETKLEMSLSSSFTKLLQVV